MLKDDIRAMVRDQVTRIHPGNPHVESALTEFERRLGDVDSLRAEMARIAADRAAAVQAHAKVVVALDQAAAEVRRRCGDVLGHLTVRQHGMESSYYECSICGWVSR